MGKLYRCSSYSNVNFIWLHKLYNVILISLVLQCHQQIVLAGFSQQQTIVKGLSPENRLTQTLLANYSSHGRPISDAGKPIIVSLTYYLAQIMALEERRQVLSTFGWLSASWKDEYLVWNSSEYDGVAELVLSPELVWLPDFGLANCANDVYDEQFYKRFKVQVSEHGDVLWSPGGTFSTSCPLDISFYPFDAHTCHIDVTGWAHSGLQVKLVNGSAEVGMDNYLKNGEWTIIDSAASKDMLLYDSNPGVPFPRVRFSLHIKRKHMFYVINLILPCMIISLLAVLVFYIPPDSGEKISLGITVLLSLSVFQLLVAENIPKTSECVPILGIYLTLIMAMTATSIIISVLVLNLHHHNPQVPVPNWLKHVVFTSMAPMLCMRKCVESNRELRPESVGKISNNYAVWRDNLKSDKIAVDARRIHTSESESAGHEPLIHVNSLPAAFPSESNMKVINEILNNVKIITSKIKEHEKEIYFDSDWKMVAKILDRFFLVTYAVAVAASSLILLVIYPIAGQKND